MHKNGLKSDPITACRHACYTRQSIRCIKNESVPVSENLIDKSMEWVFSRPKAKRFARHRRAICPGAKRAPLVRLVAPVLLTGAGWPGFNSAEGRTFAVGELFARAQRALNRARCVIARHWRVTIRPKADRFDCQSELSVRGAKRPAGLIWPKSERFARRAVGELSVRALHLCLCFLQLLFLML